MSKSASYGHLLNDEDLQARLVIPRTMAPYDNSNSAASYLHEFIAIVIGCLPLRSAPPWISFSIRYPSCFLIILDEFSLRIRWMDAARP